MFLYINKVKLVKSFLTSLGSTYAVFSLRLKFSNDFFHKNNKCYWISNNNIILMLLENIDFNGLSKLGKTTCIYLHLYIVYKTILNYDWYVFCKMMYFIYYIILYYNIIPIIYRKYKLFLSLFSLFFFFF